MVRRIFNNVMSSSNFPKPGLESKTVDWLLELMRVPFEGDEVLGLKIVVGLCSWDWGVRVLFSH